MLESIEKLPLDPLFKLMAEYKEDPNPRKVNLGIGIYFDAEGNTYVPPSVQKAFADVDARDFNYQPIGGNANFLETGCEFLLGEGWSEKVALHASCGGTQACRLFGDLAKRAGGKKIYIATPTWGNHFSVFNALEVEKFDHLNQEGEVDFDKYMQIAKDAPEDSIVLLHGGLTHNQTGKNLSLEQLEELCELWNEREVSVYIDFAYLGFGLGVEEDKKYVRLLFEKLDSVACGLSFSKNMALYEHRTGLLVVKGGDKEAVQSQLAQLTRESISMAPGIGQEVALNVLKNYRDQWVSEVESACKDIDARRDGLADLLPENFAELKETKGMFGLLPVTEDQALRLRKEFSIYFLNNGRVNFASMKEADKEYIAESIRAVV